MQVGGARVDRVDQHLLQEAHHRRILDVGGDLGLLRLRAVIVCDVELEVAADQRLERLGGAGALFVEQSGEFVMFDDDPLGR